MIMVAILGVVILTTITVSIGTQPGAGLDSATAGSSPAVGPRGRRRSRRGAGAGHVRPQYLPAVARARILRAQVPGVRMRKGRREMV
jgi:hypothetical protein